MRDLTLEHRKSVKSPPLEEEGATETMSDELTTIQIPYPPGTSGGNEGEHSRAEFGNKGEVEGRYL